MEDKLNDLLLPWNIELYNKLPRWKQELILEKLNHISILINSHDLKVEMGIELIE